MQTNNKKKTPIKLNDNYIVTSKYEAITSTKMGGKISQKKKINNKTKTIKTVRNLQRTAKCGANTSKMGGLFLLFFSFLFKVNGSLPMGSAMATRHYDYST